MWSSFWDKTLKSGSVRPYEPLPGRMILAQLGTSPKQLVLTWLLLKAVSYAANTMLRYAKAGR